MTIEVTMTDLKRQVIELSKEIVIAETELLNICKSDHQCSDNDRFIFLVTQVDEYFRQMDVLLNKINDNIVVTVPQEIVDKIGVSGYTS